MPDQNFANHHRYLPIWHFFALPILLANVVVLATIFARDPTLWNGWNVIVSVALVLAVFASRWMPLRAQDRIICLEETTRLERVLPADLRARIPELRRRHLIPLRFAPDAELADLTRRVLGGELKSGSDIKRAIAAWRADDLRV